MNRKLRLNRLCRVQRWRCYYCDGKLPTSRRFANSGAAPSLERLETGLDGGKYHRDNTVAACRGCNSSRPMISSDDYKVLRRSLLSKGWPACSNPARPIISILKEYGYATGPIEVDIQSTVETV